MEDGGTAEVYAIGNEGMIGASVIFGDPLSHTEALVQVAGDLAYKMPVSVFLREMERYGAFYQLVMRYQHALNLQIQQNAVCNALHHVEHRCCRWLITTGDRVGSDQFKLTHEFLAVMLGVRRATVTVILGTLEKAGLVAASKPGVITITNREKLMDASCECYAVVKATLGTVTAGSASDRFARSAVNTKRRPQPAMTLRRRDPNGESTYSRCMRCALIPASTFWFRDITARLARPNRQRRGARELH